MPNKKAKQKRDDRKKKTAEIKAYKKKKRSLIKIKHTKPGGFVYYEYKEKI